MNTKPLSLPLLVVLLLASSASSTEPSAPLVHWTFDEDVPGEQHGDVALDKGPLPPEYPDFARENQALRLGMPAYLALSAEDSQQLTFQHGDAITAEAWVNLKSIQDNAYIVGKGRNGTSGQSAIDQNWAFRLRVRNGQACVNFLFRSKSTANAPGDWHRWTAKTGFSPGSGWHHVAVSYRFGEPKSICGYLDGQKVSGTWDMGGPTQAAPVASHGRVWIGSAMAGSRTNSLNGKIDELRVYKTELPARVLQSRFRWNAPPPEPPRLVRGRVAVDLQGPIDGISAIPKHRGQRLLQWEQDEFGFTRLPHRYDDWGVRDDWGQPLLVRAAAVVSLPAGTHTWLVRSRGMAQLRVDGKTLLTTPKQTNRSGAHHVVDPLPTVLVEGMRPHWMNDHERTAEFTSAGGEHLVQLDIIVGGPRFRPEFGETCLALASQRPDGSLSMFHLVSPQSDTSPLPLTDDGWKRFVAKQTRDLSRLDTKRRAAANHIQEPMWSERHAWAKSHLLRQDPPQTSMDAIIAADVKSSNQAAAQPRQHSQQVAFYREHIAPLLEQQCGRCHLEKQQGGLGLNNQKQLLAGGDSGLAAIVPGQPDESYLWELVSAPHGEFRMPPKGDGLNSKQLDLLKRWIENGAVMDHPQAEPVTIPATTDDLTFLRRVSLDTVGVPPTLSEAEEFLANDHPQKRSQFIASRLADPRWADHWTGYWQDVLAENPNLLKPTLNNTGPFRYWIHEALSDNKPLDRFATELILMRGSTWNGGSAGFRVASQNDVPMAAKAHVIGAAFLGVQLKCARCHDAPYHEWKQSDLFHMAAMLDGKTIALPAGSTVPAAFFESQSREPLIDVTLKPGAKLEPRWPFADLRHDSAKIDLTSSGNSRARLAAEVTTSRRFAEVMANRIWQRFMGRGIVEPVDDWEGKRGSNPELLSYLADELIRNDFDAKALASQIMHSQAYQRKATNAGTRLCFAGPYRRRMSAEQIVDSAYVVVGQQMRTEPLTLDVEGTLPPDKFLHFGLPQRSWEFTTLANERDRPSLALPRAQAIADVLKAFGWRNSRPEPIASRDEAPNLVQPGALANGMLGSWLTRLSDDSEITDLAVQADSVERFVESLFLKMLTRYPLPEERKTFVKLLTPGFESRLVPLAKQPRHPPAKRFRYVSWSNHLNTDANKIKIEMEKVARQGAPPTSKLTADWRERAEDAVWSLLNSPEMVMLP